ncbi:hypothetical protein [Nannocystis pusilla]|uniref:Lipoprotein n=1 Tax=Nannocystis pusilla TaxID=889268 RepID=A0ABS7TQF8_9BACT|nr:hypothetical protein [Nannocystis pusilla]MBZ5710468.1 hypothetical protein [Nannocystis pusilla]
MSSPLFTAPSRLLLAALLGCGARVDPPPAEPTSAAPPDPSATAPAVAATCPIDQPAAEELRLAAVVDLGDVAGKRWLVAREGDLPVLLHLDAAGALARTRLPDWTEDIAVERDSGLRLFFTDEPTWAAVDLRDRDAPVVAAPVAVPGLVPGEYPKGVASDGARALVSLYRDARRPGGERHDGDTFLLDVATGGRLGPRAGMTVWAAHCDAGRCLGVATPNGDRKSRTLVELGESGAVRLGDLGRWDCSGLVTWLEGQEWRIAWSERKTIGLAAFDLEAGKLRQDSFPTADPDCADLAHLALPDRHGLVVTAADARRAFVPIGPDLRPGAPELLPKFEHARQRFLALGDGVLLVDFAASAGLRHGPEDADGVREYHDVWQFAGRRQYARPAPGEWKAEPAVALPHDGERGEIARGYDVHLLARPGHAGVLLAGDGLPSTWLPLRRPCP